MDLLKIAVFVAAFVLLVVIGRILSARAERYPAPPQGPAQPDGTAGARDFIVHQGGRRPAMTGQELGFPIAIPPVKRDEFGKYNRPYFKNYYFRKTDLQTGPPDPACFCDEFFLHAQDPESHSDDFFLRAQFPESQYVWSYKYLVATPAGLEQVMNEERYASLFFDGPVVVVPRWDLAVILSTVVEEIMKSYGKPDSEESAENVPRTE
ncbi:MAG TPA: hypothetical protein VF532_03590 [Candidatus Angelobacter sp.]